MLVGAREHMFFLKLNALLHCHLANTAVEKSEMVLSFDALYVIYFFLSRSL